MYEPISTTCPSTNQCPIKRDNKRRRDFFLILFLVIGTRPSTSFPSSSCHHHKPFHPQRHRLVHAALLQNVNRFLVVRRRGSASQSRGLPHIQRHKNQFHATPRWHSALMVSWVVPSLAETAIATVPASIRAVLGMIFSTAVGHRMETRVFPGSGILATLGAAAALTNLGLAPSQHKFYDWSWSTFLPASLVLLLLSLQNPVTLPSKGDDFTASTTASASYVPSESSAAMASIRRLAFPFLLASIGSVLGCMGAFQLSSVLSATTYTTNDWLLHPKDACFAAACLAASFVGGSVNFFATAAAILSDESKTRPVMTMNHGNRRNNLVTSMAAADLVIMAVYFASLGAMAKSLSLRQWFGNKVQASPAHNSGLHEFVASPGTTERNLISHSESTTLSAAGDTVFDLKNLLHCTMAAGLATSFAFLIVSAARQVEQLLLPIVPGTACAFIALVVPLVQRIWHQLWGTRPVPLYIRSIRSVSAVLSQWCFLLLFASIGMSTDLTMALRDGPACLLFSLTSILVHIGFLLGASQWWVQFRTKRTSTSKLPISGTSPWTTDPICLEEVLIASNAAIGGPATAAAFCGQLTSNQRDDDQRKGAWTVAATFYGVLGYAVGTTIGVSLHHLLANSRGLS